MTQSYVTVEKQIKVLSASEIFSSGNPYLRGNRGVRRCGWGVRVSDKQLSGGPKPEVTEPALSSTEEALEAEGGSMDAGRVGRRR